MILEWLAGVVLDVLAWVLGILPTFTLPPEMSAASMVSGASFLASGIGQVEPYVNVTVLLVCSVAVLGALTVALAAKGLRMVLSLATGGGGSAA